MEGLLLGDAARFRDTRFSNEVARNREPHEWRILVEHAAKFGDGRFRERGETDIKLFAQQCRVTVVDRPVVAHPRELWNFEQQFRADGERIGVTRLFLFLARQFFVRDVARLGFAVVYRNSRAIRLFGFVGTACGSPSAALCRSVTSTSSGSCGLVGSGSDGGVDWTCAAIA
jgi:hypothetical protein